MADLTFIRWLLARSDVERAWDLLDGDDSLEAYELRRYVLRYWPGIFSGEAYGEVYRIAGEIEAANGDAYAGLAKQPRFIFVRNWLKAHDDFRSAIDFGCSRGHATIHLHNEFPGRRWRGIDVDELSVKLANEAAAALAARPHDVRFTTDDPTDGPFDVGFMFEVLEHVTDVPEIVARVEALVRPGGWVLGSVPFGPVEYAMWVREPGRRREHLREFTREDLHRLFGGKEGFAVHEHVSPDPDPYLRERTGTRVFCYRNDLRGVGPWELLSRDRPDGIRTIVLPGG